MNTTTWRRRIAAALLIPFLLVLAGCRFHADFEVKDVDTMHIAMDLGVDTMYIGDTYGSAAEMCEAMQEEEAIFGEVTPVPYEEDGMWGCRATGVLERADFGTDFQLSEEDGTFHLVMGGGSTDAGMGSEMEALESEIDFRASFTFPGEVLESKGGTIDGNTVTYTSMSEFSNGVDIRAEAGGSFPWVIVVIVVLALGFLLLLALGLGAFLFMRSRKKGTTPAAVPGGYGSSAASGSTAVPPAPGSPAVPPAPGSHGSPAVPPASQGGQPWGGSAQQPPPTQGQQWGSSPAPAPQQGQPGQQGQQPWSQPPGQGQPPQAAGQQQPPQAPGQGQPPQNPGW